MRGVQVEWVAAGVALAVEMWVRNEAVGIQLVAAVIYMAMLVFSSVKEKRGSRWDRRKNKKKREKRKNVAYESNFVCPVCLGVCNGGRDGRPPKPDAG